MSDSEWLLNGVMRDPVASPCSWVALDPEACGSCELNPHNKPRPSPRLGFVLRLLSLQAAGAVFHYRDLKQADWEDILAVKTEQHKFYREKAKDGG